MHSITLTLTRDLFRRGRWGLLLGALAGNALPVLLLTALRMDGAIDPQDASTVILALLVAQLNMFTFGAAVLTSQGEAHRLFCYPIRNSQIAFGRLVPAFLLVAVEGAVSTLIINSVFHLDWPVWGPAIFGGVAVAAVQSFGWLTHRSAWLPFVMVVVGSGLALWLNSRYGFVFSSPDHLWANVSAGDALVMATLSVLAFAVAVWAIGRNRRGESPLSIGFKEWVCRILPAGTFRDEKLRGPIEAQQWYEWRKKGWAMPVCVLFAMTMGSLAWLIWDRSPKAILEGFAAGGMLLAAGGTLGALVLGHTGRNDATYDMSQFLATRPLTDQAWGKIVLRTIGLSVLASWLIWLAGYSVVYLSASGMVPESQFGLPRVFGRWLFPVSFVGCWTVTAVGAAIGLTGRVKQFIQVGIAIFAILIALSLTTRYTSGREAQAQVWWISSAIGGLLAVASTATVFVAAARRALIGVPLSTLLAGVFAVGALAVGLLRTPFPDEPRYWLIAPIGVIALAVLPFAAMPLAVRVNRTR
jgi:hypothetical protein